MAIEITLVVVWVSIGAALVLFLRRRQKAAAKSDRDLLEAIYGRFIEHPEGLSDADVAKILGVDMGVAGQYLGQLATRGLIRESGRANFFVLDDQSKFNLL